MKHAVHDARCRACRSDKLALIADQSARWRMQHQPLLRPPPEGLISIRSPLRSASLLHDRAGKFVIHIDGDFFNGSSSCVPLRCWNTTCGRDTPSSKPSRRIVSIRTSQLQFATSGNDKGVFVFTHLRCAGRHCLRLPCHQARTDHAALQLVAFAPSKRAIIDHEGHGQRRRIDRLRRRSALSLADRKSCRPRLPSAMPASATMSPAWRFRPAPSLKALERS
jgi:hypothetical protein